MKKFVDSNFISWLAVGVVAVPTSALYWRYSDPAGAARHFDFEKCYYAAAQAVFRGGALGIVPLLKDATFVNLPIIAWLLSPLTLLGEASAETVFNAVGIVALTAAFLLLLRYMRSAIAPAIFLMFILNGPLWYSIILGNMTHMVLLCLVGALALWERQKTYSAGLLLGIAAVVKPMFLLFGVYFLWKKNWRVVLGGATVILSALVATVVIFGPSLTIYWYQHCVSAFAGKPMPAYNVQSVEGFILRFSVGANNLWNWRPQILPFWGRVSRDIALAILFTLAGMAFWRGRAQSTGSRIGPLDGRDYLEFCLILALCVTTSTVSWTHYYLFLLVPYSLYFSGRLRLRDDRLTHVLVWSSLVLCSLPVHLHVFGSSLVEVIYYRSLQSVWLFGGLLLVGALTRSALSASARDTNPLLPDFPCLRTKPRGKMSTAVEFP